MLILFVEDEVEYSLCFDVASTVYVPYLYCCLLVLLAIGLELRYNDQLLKGIVEMFLVVVERGIFSLLDFLLFFSDRIRMERCFLEPSLILTLHRNILRLRLFYDRQRA